MTQYNKAQFKITCQIMRDLASEYPEQRSEKFWVLLPALRRKNVSMRKETC